MKLILKHLLWVESISKKIVNRKTLIMLKLEKKMKKDLRSIVIIRACFILMLVVSNSSWAQSGGHASVGLGHGEEGY